MREYIRLINRPAVCPDCGAHVYETVLHDKFHERLDWIERDLPEKLRESKNPEL